MSSPPRIALTMGDPCGVGPEIILKALPRLREYANPAVFGDPGVLERTARQLGLAPPAGNELRAAGELAADDAHPGRGSRAAGEAQGRYIDCAIAACLNGEFDALVTAPINKYWLNQGGFDFPGHTEMLGDRCGGCATAMLMAGPRLRTLPLTVHVALSEVPRAITRELITGSARLLHAALREGFGIGKPRIAVAGLNPHCGDNGLFGGEEQQVIAPAVALLSREMDISGPFPGDSVFTRALRGGFDAVIGMYHDQALIPVKLLDQGDVVNVTLGLPFPRTSVDHGTAYEIAGRGAASETSLLAAVSLAARLARNRGRMINSGT